jgi:hypothetical protein
MMSRVPAAAEMFEADPSRNSSVVVLSLRAQHQVLDGGAQLTTKPVPNRYSKSSLWPVYESLREYETKGGTEQWLPAWALFR